MDLSTYLETHEITQKDFAARLGCSPGLVSQLLSGETKYTAGRAIKIEEVTNGEVPRHVLRPDLWAAPVAEKST